MSSGTTTMTDTSVMLMMTDEDIMPPMTNGCGSPLVPVVARLPAARGHNANLTRLMPADAVQKLAWLMTTLSASGHVHLFRLDVGCAQLQLPAHVPAP